MICEKCGLDSPGDFKFCPKCGMVLEKRAKVDHGKIRDQKDAVIKAIRARDSTDTVITPAWIWIMLILYVAGIVASVAIGTSVALDAIREGYTTYDREDLFDELKGQIWIPTILSSMFYVMAAALAFMLVCRLNKHFERDDKVRESIIALLTAANASSGNSRDIQADIEMLSQADDRIRSTDKQRNPIVWTLVVAVPLIIGLLEVPLMLESDSYSTFQRYSLMLSLVTYLSYVPLFYLSHFLSVSIREHHLQWADFTERSSSTAYRLGFDEIGPGYGASIESKSYALFIVATILTLGFFMFYWWYTLIQDPNTHLKAQWDYEDRLVRSLHV